MVTAAESKFPVGESTWKYKYAPRDRSETTAAIPKLTFSFLEFSKTIFQTENQNCKRKNYGYNYQSLFAYGRYKEPQLRRFFLFYINIKRNLQPPGALESRICHWFRHDGNIGPIFA